LRRLRRETQRGSRLRQCRLDGGEVRGGEDETRKEKEEVGLYLIMKFSWDPRKADSNLRKHGVAFDEAITVFNDPLAFIFDDMEHSEEEHREIIIGYSALSRLILVCFVERAEETIRIISARRATKDEVKDYEKNARKKIP